MLESAPHATATSCSAYPFSAVLSTIFYGIDQNHITYTLYENKQQQSERTFVVQTATPVQEREQVRIGFFTSYTINTSTHLTHCENPFQRNSMHKKEMDSPREWIHKFYLTLNKMKNYSDPSYADEEDNSVPAKRTTICDALSVMEMLNFCQVLPNVELLGDGSILFAWNNNYMVGGFRFIGDGLTSCYHRDHTGETYAVTLPICNARDICRLISRIVRSFHASESHV